MGYYLSIMVKHMKDNVCIIAEAGVNHNGDLDLALKMCAAAKDAGADIVKFQTFNTDNNVLKSCEMAEYQKKNVGGAESHWEMIKRLELNHKEFRRIKDYCDEIEIEFMSTPSEIDSLNFLISLGMEKIKISSGEITNLPFLRNIGENKKQVILSSGMANLGEIEAAIDILIAAGTCRENITILHCTTEYPTLLEDVNLLAMLTIKESFKVNIGYSDHTTGVEVAIAAVALGAKIIEKHFTLNRKMMGPDHAASLEPAELKNMTQAIRKIESALGNGIKRPTQSELKNKYITRKCIVAKRKISKGETFSLENLTVKRPEKGISAMKWDEILGKKAKMYFREDEAIIR